MQGGLRKRLVAALCAPPVSTNAPAAAAAAAPEPFAVPPAAQSVDCDFWEPVTQVSGKALRTPRIQCTLCPRRCLMKPGQRGFCFVRGNDEGTMRLATYGRSSGFAVDPVEKKPLNHFLPGSDILSFGTAGCNLGCKFCQNWDISKATTDDRLQTAGVTPDAIALAAKEHGTPSVAVTYNDPVIFYEYARDVAAALRRDGLQSVAVTAGYVSPEARTAFFDCFDATNVDLKGFSERFYRELCNAKLQPVLDSLAWLAQRNRAAEAAGASIGVNGSGVPRSTWVEITTLVIPGQNDSVEETEAMAKWVVAHCGPFVPWHFTAFHPDHKMTDVERTPAVTLEQCRDIASRAGAKYVYTGNVHDRAGQTTYCHGCQEPLVVRDWFALRRYRVSPDGRCPKCDVRVPGVWPRQPPRVALAAGNARRPYRVDMRSYASVH